MLPPSGLPPYQKLLMHFLDKKAPALGKWHFYECENVSLSPGANSTVAVNCYMY